MIKRITLTDEHIKLIKNIKFEAFDFEDLPNRKHIGWGIDQYSLFGGTFALEDISRILGIWDRHIPGTEESPLGADFPMEDKIHMWQLYDDIVDNMTYIISLVFTFGLNGGLTAGTYKCHSEEEDWVKEKTEKETPKWQIIREAARSRFKNEIITGVEGLEIGSGAITFHCNGGSDYKWALQEDSESSFDEIVSISGDASTLIGSALSDITLTKHKVRKDCLWTYTFTSPKGSVMILCPEKPRSIESLQVVELWELLCKQEK